MAIRGAYSAGFTSGFAEDFVGRVDARTEKQDKYMDLMIENARAKAPKYAAYKAEQRQLDSMGAQLQTDFKLTKAEVEFLKGKGALTDFHKTVYEQRNAAAANNQTYNFDKNLFFAAMNLEDRTLPMNTSDRLAVAGKVYNDNVSGSKNPKSESTKVNSAKNALAKLLAFNPRLSAEEAVRAMEVAGYSADELMDWDPNAPRQDLYSDIAMPTTAIPVVEYTASENKNVTNESATKLRRLIGIEDVNGNPLAFETQDILGANTPKSKKTLELAALTEEGAITFAQINKRLAYQGLGNSQQLNVLSNRYSALSYFRSKIDSEEELKFLIAAEKKGLVTEFLLKNPMPTDEQLDAFFSQDPENAVADISKIKTVEVLPTVKTSAEPMDLSDIGMDRREAAYEDDSRENLSLTDDDTDITKLPNGNAVARMLANQEPSTEEPIAGSGILTAAEQMEKRIQDNDRQFLADERNFPQPLSSIVTPAQSEEDIVLEASMIAIDEELKRIQDNDRQFLADEKNYPQPLKAMTSIEPLSINTPAELDAAIEERVGEMPPDYKEQVVQTVASINKILKGFESKVNLSVDTAIDTVSPSNLAEAISNLTARMFDETLEERIMNNPGQENRAIAFAKLQEQLSELTLFPERVPVDMNDIDPYPTMDAMGAQRLHSLQADINTSILSATKKLLSRIGFGNSSTEEVAEDKPEPLVTKPKKVNRPKEMTSSDKTRLKRAQKLDELSGDSSLLEMLVKKYGIETVQKEMGL